MTKERFIVSPRDVLSLFFIVTNGRSFLTMYFLLPVAGLFTFRGTNDDGTEHLAA
jgi:hypothetical protein